MQKYGAVIMLFLVVSANLVASDETRSFGASVSGIDSAGVMYSPLIAGVSSALIPGSGQFYTKNYLRAGTFLALEAITASVSYYWYKTARIRSDMALDLRFMAAADSGIDSAKSYEGYLLMKHSTLDANFRSNNALSWMIGGYLFNVFDAVGGSGFFVNDDKKDPATAGLLSAIPGLGLGQLYNGSLSKAGMVFMTQLSLGVASYNHHRLMRVAEKQYLELDNAEKKYKKQFNSLNNEDTLKYVISQGFKSDWAYKQRTAFRNRNTYLWYSLFFYFYGIFDAVVDAHLHDYKDKMTIYPDLAVYGDGARLELNINF